MILPLLNEAKRQLGVIRSLEMVWALDSESSPLERFRAEEHLNEELERLAQILVERVFGDYQPPKCHLYDNPYYGKVGVSLQWAYRGCVTYIVFFPNGFVDVSSLAGKRADQHQTTIETLEQVLTDYGVLHYMPRKTY